MKRRTLDALLTSGGLIVAIVLAVAGGLLLWAHSFVDDNVKTQLSDQQIFFPEAGSEELASPEIGPYLNKYAGEQLTDGAQAQAYADHYIKVHLDEATGGKTYSELSTESRENPDDAELAAQVQTAFRGETLRGLLLNAYAFWKMGQIALYAAIAAFAGAAVMLILSLLGYVHMRRTSPREEIAV